MSNSSDSILFTIKKMLGIEDDYTPFDTDIIIHINSALMTLTQLGVGPKEGFQIVDSSATWNEFLTNDVNLASAKNYIYLSVKMLFDPPSNSFVMEAMRKQLDELGFRLNVQAESAETFGFVTDDDSAKKRGWPGNDAIEERAQAYNESRG